MKPIFFLIVVICLAAFGIAGVIFEYPAFEDEGPWFLALGLTMLAYLVLKRTYYRAGSVWPADSNEPKPLNLTWLDYVKALICWLDSFKRTYAVEPGLYYTGNRYEHDSPLLVTANYHLTVFVLVRRLRRNVRLLVVDTDSINVWCAAGKGTFCNDAIFAQMNRYEQHLPKDDRRLKLILPKLSLAGVDLPALREAGYDAIIGPVYGKDLPTYLSNEPYKDRDTDRVLFGLQSRLFTAPPGLLQTLKYGVTLLLALWLVQQKWQFALPVAGVLGLTAVLTIAYPVCFPYLPGKWFAVKGLSLAIVVSAALCALAAGGLVSQGNLITAILFTLASGMYFGQSYSGNSAVSNGTSVRKETARLLPVYVLLYMATLAAFIIKEAF